MGVEYSYHSDYDPVTLLGSAERTARKEHRCGECGRQILRGETYKVDTYVFEGSFESHKICRHCLDVRHYFDLTRRGWAYGMLLEDLGYMDLDSTGGQLLEGMKVKWHQHGALMPPPSETHHELRQELP